MASFKFRWTPSGRTKQRRDEAKAWETLIASMAGTPLHGQVNNIAVRNLAGNITGVNRHSPHYARWREAHRRLTLRARSDRQRETAAAATGGPYHPLHPAVPCRVAPALVVRDTIRVAVLATRTLEDFGGGTMLAAGGIPMTAPKATLAQLHAHLDAVLAAIEEELLDAATHQDDHDLRAAGHPPVQILLGSEWYFRIPNRPFDQAEYNGIIQRLEALSAKYPEWLIVPGSIFWTPDPVPSARMRAYNTAPALFAGSVVARRTKREQHDIDSSNPVRAVQRWGPDEPVAAPPYAVPGPIAATQALCTFAHRGRNVCVEICRDHNVGDAVAAYLGAGLPGADIYLFPSNGTLLTDGFLPVVTNGVAVWIDGSGNGNHQYVRVNRANPLTHNWAAPLAHPMTTYRAAFVPERDHDVLSAEGLYETYRIEHDNTPAFQSFMTKFNNVFGPANADPILMGAIDGGLGPLTASGGVVLQAHRKGRRIQQVLAGGVLPTGVPIPPGETAVMTPYAAGLVQFVTENDLVAATAVGTRALKATAANGFAVATAALNGVVAIPGFYDLTLYQLQDL